MNKGLEEEIYARILEGSVYEDYWGMAYVRVTDIEDIFKNLYGKLLDADLLDTEAMVNRPMYHYRTLLLRSGAKFRLDTVDDKSLEGGIPAHDYAGHRFTDILFDIDFNSDEDGQPILDGRDYDTQLLYMMTRLRSTCKQARFQIL
ncbi:hypothetical protein [Vibrio phage RYC]|nr:hypothetical protein [Vibrio phage RYC]